MDDSTEGKIGKLWTSITKIRGDIHRLSEAVFGNGHPGHEKRIKDLEVSWQKRRETCPVLKDHADKRTQSQIVIGLWINGAMMVAGFLAIFLFRG